MNKISTPVAEKRKDSMRLPDPGNLMLVLYILAILLFLMWGGIARADAGDARVGGGERRALSGTGAHSVADPDTCYPFDAVRLGGRLRYVVFARLKRGVT